uniref:PDZ domain-containing protein n=1 Tax=Caenorhabditis tropicalis TaxID=1561998 RepID=A0A1I7T234_9PELO
MFCVSYASSQQQQSVNTPTIHEQQEEIYSSLKKVRTADDLTSSQLSIDKHVTMIPLGSPHELHREQTANGTMIRVSSGFLQKMDMIANEKMKELVPKMRPEHVFQQPHHPVEQPKRVEILEPKKDFESWSGRAMEGRVSGGQVRGTNNIRGYWERNIQIEQRQRAEEERRQRPKSYGFPKWRSTDALSASLVASNSIQIPVDSRIPEERLRKMEETEREAIEVKKEIHEEAEMAAGSSTRKLSKGKSLDSLSMQVDYQPWYDTEKIKSAVSRESIANIATSREFFETASTRDWRSAANSRRDSMCSLNMAPPLPPKSDAMQMRQAAVNHNSRSSVYHQNGGQPYGQQYPPNLSSVSIPNTSQNVNVLTISSGFDGNPGVTKQPTQAPQTSINRLIQQDSPQTADPIEQQEVLLMLYLKQNLDIVHGLGIHIPSELLAEMEDLQMLPVELKISDEEQHRMFSPVNKNGRYQRKPQMNMIPNRQMISQKYPIRKDIPISTRSRQNSEMTNSNVDLSYHHHPHSSSSYGYH